MQSVNGVLEKCTALFMTEAEILPSMYYNLVFTTLTECVPIMAMAEYAADDAAECSDDGWTYGARRGTWNWEDGRQEV